MSREVIYRYEMAVEDFPEILMPARARVLSVAPGRTSALSIDLWAVVDPTEPLVPHKFRVVGTGNSIGEELGGFIGTVSLLEGRFIGHVFTRPFR